MLLESKTAVIYGAGGAIGGAVARTFAREGAELFLAGRTEDKLDAVAKDITAGGGVAHTTRVDALDEAAVERHADAVAERAGSIDVCVNTVGIDAGDQGIPLVDLSADDYLAPIAAYARANFVTAKAAARHMMTAGSGVILHLTPPMSRMPTAMAGPFGMAGAAIESMCLQLAAELGPYGIRVVGLRLNGIPETAAHLGSHTRRTWGGIAERMGVPFEELLERIGGGGHLPQPLSVEKVANVAAFMASARADGMTGTIANVTGGSSLD